MYGNSPSQKVILTLYITCMGQVSMFSSVAAPKTSEQGQSNTEMDLAPTKKWDTMWTPLVGVGWDQLGPPLNLKTDHSGPQRHPIEPCTLLNPSWPRFDSTDGFHILSIYY